jgi:dinuclear metal center YbgI/SA1388 family protein
VSFSLAAVTRTVHELWPLAGAEGWDAPGLASGDPAHAVGAIHLAVDAVAITVDEAIAAGADLLLVHHPLLLRGVTSIAADRYKGALLGQLIRADCALLAAHTNADVVANGVSDILAKRIGLVDTRPIIDGAVPGVGVGRVGRLERRLTLGELARRVATVLPATASGVRVSGEYGDTVETVAVCGGAGDSLLSSPLVLASDVYITSDLRHHPVSEAREQARLVGNSPALIDVSHWASEWLWLDTAAAQLREALPGVRVSVSDLRTDPWDFVIVQ